MTDCIILGAGGHAKVVADILLLQGTNVIGFLDDDDSKWGTELLGLPVLGPIASGLDYMHCKVIIGIGNNSKRRELAYRFQGITSNKWQSAIHPSAIISQAVKIGQGVCVVAGAIIEADTCIGNHVIINTAATIAHDCIIGDYVHIAPGTHLAGGVIIGDGAMLGVGTTVIPQKRIGCGATIGAGAVVVHDIPDGVTAKGVPARW